MVKKLKDTPASKANNPKPVQNITWKLKVFNYAPTVNKPVKV